MAKRMRTKLREIKEQLKATRHDGIDGQGKWLAQVLRGWIAYYAVPMSGSAISAFRRHTIERWHGALMRRSQRHRLTWTRMKTIAVLAQSLASCIRGQRSGSSSPSKVGARCVSSARRDLCGGRRVIAVPTATSELARRIFTRAALVGAAMCSAFRCGSHDRWP